jgi:outer membrane immunogenic protein
MGDVMKTRIMAIAAMAALTGSQATAADMPLKAPPPPPVWSWTGCYVGGNVGGKEGSFHESDFTPAATGFGTTTLAGTDYLPNASGSSIAGGGQIGCRWEAPQHWVVGLEGDFDGTNVNATQTITTAIPVGSLIPGDSFSIHERWESSIRANVGYAWDRWLAYVTGGGAFTRVDKSANYIPTTVATIPFPASAGSDSATLSGFTVGAGVAYAFNNNWDLGIEYRYSDYGHANYNLGTVPAICTAGGACVAAPVTGNVGLHTSEVLVKLDYTFTAWK